MGEGKTRALRMLAVAALCLSLAGQSQTPRAEEPVIGRVPMPSRAVAADPPHSVTTFRVFELQLKADNPGENPYTNGPLLEATFAGLSGQAEGRTSLIKGFWDGGNVWRLRFAPTAPGTWSYVTRSSDPAMNGVRGTLSATSATPAQLSSNALYRGFLEPDGHAWRLSDGTGFLPVGDTQWSFAEENTIEEWETWMSVRSRQGFNTFLGCVWLGKYVRKEATPVLPFPQGDPATDRLQPAYFQRLDRMVQYANDHGIMMGLTIGGFPANSRWFQRFRTRERNDRWFRYCVARYAAYNVRWCLYGEVNEADPPWGGTWAEEAAHGAALIRQEDPYRHPIGSHHTGADEHTAGDPDIDYIEVQIGRTEDQYLTALRLRKYGKPVWFEEYWYEPASYDKPPGRQVPRGIRNTHRNFVAAMAFPTMGSLMRAHATYDDFPPAVSARAGKTLQALLNEDPGAVAMSHFAAFYRDLDLRGFSPQPKRTSAGVCGRFGKDYAVFVAGGGNFTLDLSDDEGVFSVRSLDIHTGKVSDLGRTAGGQVARIEVPAGQDSALLFRKPP